MATYRIDMDEELDGVLSGLARSRRLTKPDVIRRALTAYEYLTHQAGKPGQKISITTADDRVVQDVVLP